ncbi:50S ribosomal protein L11 methyltransferase [Athalassotoga sp.]|uniref:50S ribosomal protein L11 methyltransferase n=1 Tax=Athalassotoga sp. TaxID=2022597 RepID=UPI003D03BB8C
MKRKSFKFEVDKSSSDEIMELLANYDCQNFYSESRPNDDEEVFHLFCDEEKVDKIMKIIVATFELEWVEDEDWIKKWSESLKIVKVGNELYVNPNPDKFKDPENGITVKIIPGMAFGTGEHESTKIAIRFLQKVMKKGLSVCDVGCGSGIISAFAVKLGAERVLALDSDQLAVQQSLETAELNNVDYEVRKNDLMEGINENFDIVVANIYYDVIIKLIDQLPKNIIFIISGIDKGREKDMEKACFKRGMNLIDKDCEGEWCGFIFSC